MLQLFERISKEVFPFWVILLKSAFQGRTWEDINFLPKNRPPCLLPYVNLDAPFLSLVRFVFVKTSLISRISFYIQLDLSKSILTFKEYAKSNVNKDICSSFLNDRNLCKTMMLFFLIVLLPFTILLIILTHLSELYKFVITKKSLKIQI